MIAPECVDWYARYAADRWKTHARATLTGQMLAAPAEHEEGYVLALEQLDELPAPVDVEQFIRTTNSSAAQWFR